MEPLINVPTNKAQLDWTIKVGVALPKPRWVQLIYFEVTLKSSHGHLKICLELTQHGPTLFKYLTWGTSNEVEALEFASDYQQAISTKVDKLFHVGFISKVWYLGISVYTNLSSEKATPILPSTHDSSDH